MDTNSEVKINSKKISVLFGVLVAVGIVTLVTSTLLQLADVFPNTPSLVFKLINGFSIGFVIVCGFAWSIFDKKVQKNNSPN